MEHSTNTNRVCERTNEQPTWATIIRQCCQNVLFPVSASVYAIIYADRSNLNCVNTYLRLLTSQLVFRFF